MPPYSNCKELFAALSQYLDAELAAGDCAAIEAHIAGCAPCVQFVASLKQTVEMVKDTGKESTLPRIPEEVLAKLQEAYRQSLERGR